MNIVSDPKAIPQSTLLSPEANQAAALAASTGVLTVDLDAIVANWRKLEKTAVPAECAGVVKANAYGCGSARNHPAYPCRRSWHYARHEPSRLRRTAP